MKKIALTSLLAVFAVSAANADTKHFVGGSAALVLGSNHSTVLSVAPEFGWKYSKDWDLGVTAKLGYDQTYLPANYGVNGDTYSYGVGAFARYRVTQFGGVKLLLKGSAVLDMMTLSPDAPGADSETTAEIGVAVVPMITYDISESFTLYANLNFLGFYTGYVFENKDLGINDRFIFGIVGNTDTVANTGNFQIGFNYNF